MKRPNVHQLLAATFDVRDVDACITYLGTEPEYVTIEGRQLAYRRALEIGDIGWD